MYQKALKIKIACLGTEEHTSVADSYNNIGNVLADQGDLKGAIEMYQKALKITSPAWARKTTPAWLKATTT